MFKWDQIRSNWFKSVLIARIWGWGLDLHPALPFVFDYWEFWLMLVSLKSNHVLSNGSKSINCQHFHSVYIWFVSWNAGIKIDCPIFDLSILLYYYIARDLHNILTFHNQVTVRKTKIKKSFSSWQNNNKSWNAIPNYTLADPVSSILGEHNEARSFRDKPKLSLKIKAANTICWNYLVLFRDYGSFLFHFFYWLSDWVEILWDFYLENPNKYS